MGWKLAELFVEISMKGLGAINQQLDNVKGQLEGIQKGADLVGDKAAKGFAVASAAVGGWVAAGLRGTVQANALAFQFQQLSRGIGDIFAPAINQAIELLTEVTQFFRNLSDEQKDN